LYGSIDGGYTNKQDKVGVSNTMFGSAISKSNRIGFRGTEDLGGGLKALFVLETGFNSGKETPSSIGDRGAFLGLAGGFGTVTLGSSQLTPSFYAGAAVNPTGSDNFGLLNYAITTRFDNSVNYQSPAFFGGLVLRGAMIQKADNAKSAASDISAIYTNGGLTLAASAGDNGFDKGTMIGGAYNFGMFEVFARATETAATRGSTGAAAVSATSTTVGTLGTLSVLPTNSVKYTNIGVSVPVTTAIVLAADFEQREDQVTNFKGDTLVASARYMLSKRTAVTAYVKKADQPVGTLANDSTEFGFGVGHTF
jgi:predicted porin